MIIMKFGGTSVQNEEAIGRVISIVRSRLRERPLVVVSALAKVTRLLCDIADEAEAQHEGRVKELLAQLKDRHVKLAESLLASKPELLSEAMEKMAYRFSRLETFVSGVCKIGELSPRSEARIISNGELLSSIIIGYAFNANGITCKWLDARKMVITDENYMSARPDLAMTEANVKRAVAEDTKGAEVVITQGFIASSTAGFTSVLGFEGSDYSAALFGMALGASRVEIWTDVDGIRTADPRTIGDTERIEKVSYEEAAEMAAMGARVLHPLTIEPARKKNIPILVLNSGNSQCPGTVVTREDKAPVGPKSIATQERIFFITVQSPKLIGVTNMLAKVSTALAARNIPVVMATASESEVYVTVPQEKDGLEEGLDDVLKSLSTWAEVTVYRNKAQISIIGRGMIAFEGLGDKTISLAGKVYMVSLGTNLLSESFVIDRDRLQDTLEGLHNYIFKQS